MEFEIYFDGAKKINAKVGDKVIMTDQPVQAGGEGSAPEPFTLFLVSIGTCAGIYIKSFCDQRGIPSEGIKIIQSLNFNQSTRLIENIYLDIKLPVSFPEKYKNAVINAANLCTVKRHLQNPPQIEVKTSTV
ncbi:OsmC family protein [Bacteroidota bacterium]